jgi:hypothetical protein
VTLPPGDTNNRQVDVNVPIIDDLIVEAQQTFVGYIHIQDAVDASTIMLARTATMLIINDDDDAAFNISLENTVYQVIEDEGVVEVCIVIDHVTDIDCPIEFSFNFSVSTVDGSAVAPLDYVNMRHMLKFDKCETRRCVNVTVNNDITLEQEESFVITVTLEEDISVFYYYYRPLEGEIKIMDDKDELDIDVGLESTSYLVAENFGKVEVCVSLQRVNITCAIGFPFSVNLSTADGSAVFTADYGTRSMVFFFDACTPRVCEALTVVDDDISERVESFYLTLERTSDLDNRIILNRREGEVTINDDDDVTVGFSAMSYVTTETDGHVSICVDVLNPAAEGALKPFTVGLLPEPGFDTSSNQYTLECSVRLHFDINDARQCYKYNVTDDNICEKQTIEIFQVRLTLITTNDSHLQIHSKYSLTSAWIDDTEEPECCKFIKC